MKKTLKEITKVNMEVGIKDDRLMLYYNYAGQKVSGAMDITQLYWFFKEIFTDPEVKKMLENPITP